MICLVCLSLSIYARACDCRLGNGRLDDKQTYESIVKTIKKHSFLDLDIYSASQSMERCSMVQAKGDMSYVGVGIGKGVFDCEQSAAYDPTALATVDKPTYRRTEFPPDPSGRADDAWHLPQQEQWGRFPSAPPRGELYNGMVMMVSPYRDIWLVENGTRHGFPNMDTFASWGFDLEIVLGFKAKNSENGIPIGEPIPAGSSRAQWHQGKRDRSKRALRVASNASSALAREETRTPAHMEGSGASRALISVLSWVESLWTRIYIS